MHARNEPRLAWLLLACSMVAGCSAKSSGGDSTDADARESEYRAVLKIPDYLEVPAIPSFNPPTTAKLALGRRLFYEKRLSGNQTQSCSSCHAQKFAFADGLKATTGSTGEHLKRNSPGLANAFYHSTLTWANNALLVLEDQLQVPIRGAHPVELGVNDGNVAEVLARFEQDPAYAQQFGEAFPDSPSGVTIEKIVFSLATFCRALVSSGSAYDRFQAGDKTALTAEQRHGADLFNGERLECFHCHSGVNGTVSYRDFNTTEGTARSPFFNNGLYNVGGDGSYPAEDQGLYDVTQNPDDRGLFRPPSLRNVALTAPYMHDGSIPTLVEVIKHYAAGGRLTESGPFAGDGRTSPSKSGLIRGFLISDEELKAVVSFLESMTDQSFVDNPDFSDPNPSP